MRNVFNTLRINHIYHCTVSKWREQIRIREKGWPMRNVFQCQKRKKTCNNNITSALKQEIIALKDQGHTCKQISEKFDLANSTVSKMYSVKGRKDIEAALMTTSELKQKKISIFLLVITLGRHHIK
ncbi:unnamed protein product [Meganyctiphanes norvegica]|uniref:Resolvase HTH domain-containing protein n=1 Tax=Meganyctiphanes norvegica TaxID=48144 RepID=A0AAV2Q479_MEGNR